MTVAEIAKKLGGVLVGDGAADVTGMAGLEDASTGDITFFSNPKYEAMVEETGASAVVTSLEWEGKAPCAVIKVTCPDASFALVAKLIGLAELVYPKGVHPSVVVAEGVVFGKDVSIGPLCVIEAGVRIGDGTVMVAGCYIGRDVIIGSNCKLHSNVSVREGTIIGDRVILHNGAVIGSDGFGNYIENGKWKKIPQIGIVVIGNDVEIGANTTVDRARFGKTIIEDNVRIDNLVQIAHNVRIGENTAMASQCGISGSVAIGKNVLFGGQSACVGHIHVADNTIVAGRAVLTKDTEPGSYVYGFPAMPYKKAFKIHAHLMGIGEMKARLKMLEKKIKDLEENKEREDL